MKISFFFTDIFIPQIICQLILNFLFNYMWIFILAIFFDGKLIQ